MTDIFGTMYYVYLIKSLKNARYYVGQTQDLEERVKRHNQGRNISTKSYMPWQLRWWKGYETRSDAIKVETKIKGIKKRVEVEKFLKENNFRGVAQSG